MKWDESQAAVIVAGVASRLIVDAGPGTGKTAVACARLGHLINSQSVRPSQVWMISFTRTAVAEIRARLHGHIGDASFAVKVATVDAHAWAIHSGYDASASLTGSYEENIDRVLAMIENDGDIAEYLENVEHLVVDEAQDLVGQRAELVEAIVARLDPGCGVTVFADEAQAIYGFSEEDSCKSESANDDLLERLRAKSSYGFEASSLDNIHRTSAPGLRSIFSDVRNTVIGGRGKGEGLFSRIRQSIATHADGNQLKVRALGIDKLAAGSLVLFRTRAEALQASQFCTAPHSLRLSGYGANLPAWLAICFHDWLKPYINRNEFSELWLSRVETGSPPQYGPDEAWAKLTRLGGSPDGSLELSLLRRVLARPSAPVELADAEYGLPGPVVGTIHASKGREADDVFLLVSGMDEFDSPEEEEEETRVLFVGSTRARNTLNIGSGSKYPGSRLESGRCYRRLAAKNKQPAAMIEIGRSEDFSIEGLVGTSNIDLQKAETSQKWLARHAGVIMALELNSDADFGWNFRLSSKDEGLQVAIFSDRFRDDIWEIAKRMAKKIGTQINTPSSVRYVRGLGCRTLVIASDDLVREKLHAPWSQSGFVLAPRVAAFTRAQFWKARK